MKAGQGRKLKCLDQPGMRKKQCFMGKNYFFRKNIRIGTPVKSNFSLN